MVTINVRAMTITLAMKRIERGWDKSTLAAVAGINHSLVSRAEQGKRVSPATAKAISVALESEVFDLFELVDGGDKNGS